VALFLLTLLCLAVGIWAIYERRRIEREDLDE